MMGMARSMALGKHAFGRISGGVKVMQPEDGKTDKLLVYG